MLHANGSWRNEAEVRTLLLMVFVAIVAFSALGLVFSSVARAAPVPGVGLTYICQVPGPTGGTAPIFRISNGQNVPGLTITTTRNVGPQAAPVPSGQSFFRGANGTTVVRFEAPGFDDREIPKASGNLPCRGTLNLDKVVEGDGPAGPYEVEIRRGDAVERTVELTAGQTSASQLPSGFDANDYPGYTSRTTIDYTVVETGRRGADSVAYDPGQGFALAYGQRRTVTITNTFRRPAPGDLEFVCNLGGGDAIWRIQNPGDRTDLTFTTTRGAGPDGVAALPGNSTFRGSNATTAVRFTAPGFSPQTVTKEPGDRRCEGTLSVDKVVRGDGPAGPYEFEVREGADVVRAAEVTAPNPTEVTLPAGFATDDYPGFTSQARGPYTLVETRDRGADRVTYDPGQEFFLSNGQSRRVTITNTFFPPVPGVNLTSICELSRGEGGDAIWRITNSENVPGLTFTTIRGVGPDGVAALPGSSTFKGRDVTTIVRFTAPGFSPRNVVKAANDIPCQGTLRVDKVVRGDGPDGPYEFEVREGADVVRAAEVTAPNPTEVSVPTGFATDDYPGFTSQARGPFAVVETGRRGADRVTYDPGQQVSLSNGDTRRITITNTFLPSAPAVFSYVCSLGGGQAIWRITNERNVPGLTLTTTRGAGPDGVAVLPDSSTFRGSDATTALRFSAPDYSDQTVTREPGDRRCEGTLRVDKVVRGDGPRGPYEFEVREGSDVVRAAEVTAPDPTEVNLPTGFATDDYSGFESSLRGPFTVVETGTRGADRVTYDPEGAFSLTNGSSRTVTITNVFDPRPIPGADLTFVCQLSEAEGGAAIWRISNPDDVSGLRFTTTQGTGPDGVAALRGQSTFRGSDAATTVRFTAPGLADRTVTEEPGSRTCRGTLSLDKIVRGNGPAGPYPVEVSSAGLPDTTVQLNAAGVSTIGLLAGFETDDYEGYGSRARQYSIREVDSLGARQVLYEPGRSFALTDGQSVRATVINVFGPLCADLTVKVTAPSRVTVGDTFAYTVTATNLGPADVRSATLTSRLPASVRFVRASEGCRYDRATRTVTCALGSMPEGTQKERKIVVEALEAGSIRLRGCAVKSGTPDCNPSNNELRSTSAQSPAPGSRTLPQGSAPGVGPETTVVPPPEEPAQP